LLALPKIAGTKLLKTANMVDAGPEEEHFGVKTSVFGAEETGGLLLY
jgi:hypothetical protein